MMDRESAGYLLGETAHLLRVNAALAIAALIALTFVGVVADLYPDFASPAGLASAVMSLVLQYEIGLALLVHYGLVDSPRGRRRFWAMLGLSLVSSIGIVLGLIILIIPGIYLLVRWSAAVPSLIAEEAGVFESLSRSAEAVEGRFWQVFGAILVVWTPLVPALLAAGLIMPKDQRLIEALISNIAINLCLIVGWHLAVAIYAGRQDNGRLAEVFA
jgi:hypothetical protein